MNKKIIAIVGMCGSGKSVVTEYLTKKLDAPKVYLGEATFERMKADGLELNYENEQITREKIRDELGMGAYAILAKDKINDLLKENDTVIVESMYSWDEYKIFREEFGENFKTLAVFASPSTRFARLTSRNNERPMKDIETFLKRDYTEIENIAKGGPIARADYTLINEGTEEELFNQIDQYFN